MSIDTVAVATADRTIQLPPIGTPIPHLGGTFWALMRAKPGSGQADYALIVPHGDQYERKCAWGAEGKAEPEAACMWDGLANTRALIASKHDHPAAQFCADLAEPDMPELYLPSLRECRALFASGCDAFSADGWYWTSTQFDRSGAYYQNFNYGSTYYYDKSWESGRARAVRRASIESLNP